MFKSSAEQGRTTSSDTDIKLEMISFVPSCNTDQGAFYSREYWSDENFNAQWKWRWEKDSGGRELADALFTDFEAS